MNAQGVPLLEDKKQTNRVASVPRGKKTSLRVGGKRHGVALHCPPPRAIVVAVPSFDLSSLQIFSVLPVVSISKKNQ